MWMIGTNSNAIHILQIIRKLPGFSVQKFQLFVGKLSISASRIFVFVLFVKLVLQLIVLIFMRQQKIFPVFALLGLFFRSTIGSLTALIDLLRIGILVVSDVVDRLTLWYFNKVLGYFYLSKASGHVDAVNISSSAAELEDSNLCAYI